MRKIVASFVTLLLSASSSFGGNDPVIMTIAGDDIYKSEFEYIYNKNNSVATAEKKSLQEYVDLFVNYKLKVTDAKKLGYQYEKAYLKEYEDYRMQLASSYLQDEETEKRMISEAFDRCKSSILASHILVSFSGDTVKPWKKINEVYERLKNGEDFAKMAREYSDCPSKSQGGSLGYVNVFDMVYKFENVVYSTPLNTISKPFRTKFGYHIVKTFDKKENFKDWRISHIMISVDQPNAKAKADSIFALVKNGADFHEVAAKFSDDKMSANKGGDLGYLSQGMFPKDITSRVKSLRGVGELAFCGTAFGYHVIKLTEAVPYEDVREEEAYLKERVSKSDRYENVAYAYLLKLKDKYGLSTFPNSLNVYHDYYEEKGDASRTKIARLMTNPMYTFRGNVYPQIEFFEFFQSKMFNKKDINKHDVVLIDSEQNGMDMNDFEYRVFNMYLIELLIKSELADLEETNPEYRNLLREYSDGLLLFEVSSKKVWNKASESPAELAAYFDANKDKYKWNESKYKGFIVYAKDKKVHGDVEKILKNNNDSVAEKLIREKYITTKVKDAKIEKGVFAKGVNKIVDDKVFHGAEYKNAEFPFVSMRGKLIDAPTSYEDVRGPVTSDYQNYLEAEWVKDLRKKYEVKVYDDVLKTVKE